MQLLYYTLIHPYFNYCNILWACQDNFHTPSLYRFQRKAIRLVTLAPWNSQSALIFKRLNILNIFDINKLQVGWFVYKYLTGLLPFSFADYYIRKYSIQMIVMRNSNDLYLPRHKTKQSRKLHSNTRSHSVECYFSRNYK